MKLNFFIWFLLKINIIDIYSETIECPIETPLYNKYTYQCVYEAFSQGTHEISNSIIETQWLNKINQLGEYVYQYFGTDLSSKGDLIIQSFKYIYTSVDTKRYIYGIKNNGRSFFYKVNKFYNLISIDSNSNAFKYESEFFHIKLTNSENDYFLSPCFENFPIEIMDLYNNRIIGVPQTNLFGSTQISSKLNSVFELSKEPRTYLFCFIGNTENPYYIIFQKFKFNNVDISQTNSYEMVSSSVIKEELKVHKALQLTCVEISKYDIIQCFYVSTTNYLTIGLFNENSYDIIQKEIFEDYYIPESEIDCLECNFYYQCIHLKNEISIFGYTLGANNHDSVYIKLKQIIYNDYLNKYELEDFLLRYDKIEIKLEGKTFNTYYYINHLKKINDNKFSLISTSEDNFQLYVFIFELYNFHETNLFIRYYCIQLKLYNLKMYRYLKTIKYNDFLGLLYSIGYTDEVDIVTKFNLFSYVNGTDSSLINLGSNTVFKLSDYINEGSIENNIFGVELYGIKILKLPNCNGVYFFSNLKRNIIFENDILLPQDEIHFIYDNAILAIGTNIYTIEIAGVVKEQSYSESIKYTIKEEYYGVSPPSLYYQPEIKIGKTCFYNFTIRSRPNVNYENSCTDNCKICYQSICIKCNDDYKLIIKNSNECIETNTNNNYYYDENSNVYKKCHENCKNCLSGPIYYRNKLEIEDTNCQECIDNYFKLEDTNNCVDKDNPPERYYFDDEQYLFVRCHENCKTCSQGPINSTYSSCLSCDENSILYPETANCLNCLARNKYTNYYENKCLDYIPEGYYVENEGQKLLGKCYFSCKTCNSKGDSNDHKCLVCGDTFIYKNKDGTKCLDDCLKEYSYVDTETNICFDDCSENINQDKKYNFNHECKRLEDKPDNYEVIGNTFVRICYYFNNECNYDNCPEGTKLDNSITTTRTCICNNLYYINDGKFICVNSDNCPTEYPYLEPDTLECKCKYKYNDQCVSICPINTNEDQINEDLIICNDIKIQTTEIQTTEIQTQIQNVIQIEEIDNSFFNFSKILDKVEKLNIKNNLEINDYPNVTINIYINGAILEEVTTLSPNLTFINLDKCGEELKEYYKLNSDENLYIATFERSNHIENRVTNEFNFEIYLKNGTQLKNLSICNDKTISASSSISKLDLVNFKEAEIFNSQGYDIYNLSSEFYTDKCSSANINGNDIVLKDRREDIYPDNISFCSNGCELNNVEIETKRVNCSCNLDYKEEEGLNIDNNTEKFNATENFITYLLDNVNYQIFKCYKILFKTDIKNLISNVGFFLGIGVILFTIVSFFIFFFVFLPKIRIQIFKLVPNKRNFTKKPSTMRSTKKRKKTKKKKKTNKTVFINSNSDIPIQLKKNLTRKGKLEIYLPDSNSHPVKRKFQKESEENINTNYKAENNKTENNNKIEEKEYNFLPYTQALRLDKRNICSIYLSLIKMKIDIIPILFFPEEFTHRSITLAVYLSDFLFSFFMNAFLYTDDVVSEKYHNNGQLNLFTTLFLTLTSNIVSSILIYFIEILIAYKDYLVSLVKEINKEYSYILTFKKLYKILKIKVYIFYVFVLILSAFMMIYILIFCQIYKKSQNNLLINYVLGLVESLAYSIGITIIISILRFISLKYKLIYIYRTSVYLDGKF